jgi:peptidyl-prolyl cis-trans isomerase D
VKVSEAEVRDAWKASADRTSLSFVQIPLAAAEAEVKISDDDAKAFADKEKDRIEKFYKENAARFDQKKKARVRHILAAAPQGADDGAAKAKIEAAAARVKKGEDFGKVAQEVSDDANTKGRGGELGFVAEGLADEAFAKAALGLEKGQVSEPVRTPSGWHLLQVEEVVPARQVSLDAARTEIAKELLRKERAGKLARERAEAALEAAKKGKSLAELFPAEDAGKKSKKQPVKLGDKVIVPDETGSFGVGAPILPKLGAAPELARAAADAKAGEVLPKVYDAAAGPVIAVVKTRERPDEAAFAKERDATEDRLRGARLEQARRAWLASLRENAKIEENHALVQGAQRAAQPE